MTSETIAIIAVVISGATFALNAGLQLWGGGTGFQLRFTKLKESCEFAIAQLRKEVFDKHDLSHENTGETLRGIREQMHSLELNAANFRAFVAEKYMKTEHYDKMMDEVKHDVRKGFEKLEKHIDTLREQIAENRREDNRVR